MLKLAGVARSNAKDHLPWSLTADNELVILIQDGMKKPMSVASVMAHSSAHLGITEVNVMDYDVAAMLKENGDAMNFRYKLSSKSKLNCFVPKAVESSADMHNLRGTILGAAFAEHFDALPKLKHARLAWEVLQSHLKYFSFLVLCL